MLSQEYLDMLARAVNANKDRSFNVFVDPSVGSWEIIPRHFDMPNHVILATPYWEELEGIAYSFGETDGFEGDADLIEYPCFGNAKRDAQEYVRLLNYKIAQVYETHYPGAPVKPEAQSSTPAIGTKVIFSVFPHFRKVAGVVVEGGVQVTDPEIAKDLDEAFTSDTAQWDAILECFVDGVDILAEDENE